jgi:effector-binding domain-containing protein
MMSQENSRIEHKRLEDTLVAATRFNAKNRKEIKEALSEVKKHVSEENITGPGFCIIQFVTSVKQGYDAEIGFPVNRNVEQGGVKTRVLPRMDILSLVHRGPVEDLGKSYNKLYSNAYEHGLISDEFCREVYLDSSKGHGSGIEIQFVIHNWAELFARNLARVIGAKAQQEVMQGSNKFTFRTTVEERFQWTKAAIKRLESLADEEERYDIVSSCAHVFPKNQIEKLRAVYEDTMQQTRDMSKAVDAVIAFMADDPGWAERPCRDGKVIYSSKKPRDPKAYEKAQDKSEKKKAYCYCPLVREHLDKGMPITFCYCGAGWYRQQWEGVVHMPVRVEIVSSILKGDDQCEFAIHLPDDLS